MFTKLTNIKITRLITVMAFIIMVGIFIRPMKVNSENLPPLVSLNYVHWNNRTNLSNEWQTLPPHLNGSIIVHPGDSINIESVVWQNPYGLIMVDNFYLHEWWDSFLIGNGYVDVKSYDGSNSFTIITTAHGIRLDIDFTNVSRTISIKGLCCNSQNNATCVSSGLLTIYVEPRTPNNLLLKNWSTGETSSPQEPLILNPYDFVYLFPYMSFDNVSFELNSMLTWDWLANSPQISLQFEMTGNHPSDTLHGIQRTHTSNGSFGWVINHLPRLEIGYSNIPRIITITVIYEPNPIIKASTTIHVIPDPIYDFQLYVWDANVGTNDYMWQTVQQNESLAIIRRPSQSVFVHSNAFTRDNIFLFNGIITINNYEIEIIIHPQWTEIILPDDNISQIIKVQATCCGFESNLCVTSGILYIYVVPFDRSIITFHMNGGNVNGNINPIIVAVDRGTSVGWQLHPNPIKHRHIHENWNTEPNGNGHWFDLNTIVNYDINVYAQWFYGTWLSISPGEGTMANGTGNWGIRLTWGQSLNDILTGVSWYTENLFPPLRDGYLFSGWNFGGFDPTIPITNENNLPPQIIARWETILDPKETCPICNDIKCVTVDACLTIAITEFVTLSALFNPDPSVSPVPSQTIAYFIYNVDLIFDVLIEGFNNLTGNLNTLYELMANYPLSPVFDQWVIWFNEDFDARLPFQTALEQITIDLSNATTMTLRWNQLNEFVNR